MRKEYSFMKKTFLRAVVFMMIIFGMMSTSAYAIESSDIPTITGLKCTDYNSSSNTYTFSWDKATWPELPESVPLRAYDPTFGCCLYWSTDKENWQSKDVSYAVVSSHISRLEEGKIYYIRIRGWFKTTSRIGTIHNNYTYGQYSDILEFVANEEKSVPGYQEPSPSTAQAPVTGTSNQGVIGSLSYSVGNGTATVVTPISTTAARLSIPATVKINGRTLPVTSIAPNAFAGMKNLTSIVIGKNVKSVGKNAFKGCSKLKKITIRTIKLAKRSIGANAFKGIHKKAVVKCPKAKKATYKKILLKKGMKKTMTFK